MRKAIRKTTIITDPIHKVMNFGSNQKLRQCFFEVIDTRAFQRLRRITQLGLASYVFPGATHTRFSHCLGAGYLAHALLNHLHEWAEDPVDQREIKDVFNEVTMAAVLHDVGHGPFSHSFERVLKKHSWAPTHEDWTRTLITHRKSDIHRALLKHGANPARIASAFGKDAICTSNGLPHAYKQIVSSQIDVDRMDYLLRDSHSAGVAIGQFDAHYLIHSMVIVDHCNSKCPRTLGLTAKGVKAYEAFLWARQLMNRTLYFHHNVQVLEFLIERLFRVVMEDLSYFTKRPRLSPIIPPYFRRIGALMRRKPTKGEVLDEAQDDYARLTEDAAWVLIASIADMSGASEAQRLATAIITRQIPRHFVIQKGKQGLLQQALLGGGFVDDVDFHVLDIRSTMYEGKLDRNVFVVGRDGSVDEIATHSDTINAFRDRPEAESLLIVLNPQKTGDITRLGIGGQFIAEQRSEPRWATVIEPKSSFGEK
jgi:hypothetical protein